MKTTRQLTTIIGFFMVMILITTAIKKAEAQKNQTLKQQTYQAYLTNSLTIWKTIEKNTKEDYKKDPDNMQLLMNLTEIQYGLLNCCLANQAKEEFKKYIEKTKANVHELLEANPKWSKVHAIKAGLLSLEIGFYPAKGMFLGTKSQQHIKKAIEHDQSEPTGWIQKGGSKFHTPKMFGGNISEAIHCYKKGVKLYEKKPGDHKNEWQYINALAWLGNAYAKNEQYDKALKTYEKALEVEPGFNWVKYDLMKNLKEKLKKN